MLRPGLVRKVIATTADTFDGMLTNADYLAAIRRESSRFAECLRSADGSDRVPSCPDWTADDLLWHLAEVQLFWAAIVRDRLADPEAADAEAPERPPDRAALSALFGQATDALVAALTTTPPETAIWTWATDQNVAFVTHWQAHEALMHRVDAELVVGDRGPIDPPLAADGIETALTIVYGDLPSWSTFTPDGATGLIEARDTGATWSIALGRFNGTSPNTGNTYDRDTVVLTDGSQPTPSFAVRGDAADVDAWLWGRASSKQLEIDGDRDEFARLERVVEAGIQ
jgi:uncharacterized protein (TIGR03083 family)